MCHVSTIIFNFQLSIFNSIETHQSHRVYFHRCNWYVSTIIFNFQLSIFNSIETHQSHRVYFHWCNVSRLYHNFQFSIFDFQFSIRLRRTNYIVFIFIGVMCHVSTIIFNFQFSIFNSIEAQQLHRVYFHRCNVSRLYHNFQLSTFNFQLSRTLFRHLLFLPTLVLASLVLSQNDKCH